MKKKFLAVLIMGITAAAIAAEVEPVKYRGTGDNDGVNPFREQDISGEIKLAGNSPYINFGFAPKNESIMYRATMKLKASSPCKAHLVITDTFWRNDCNVGSEWQKYTFYFNNREIQQMRFVFPGKTQVTMKELKLEKLSENDLLANALPEATASLGDWFERWWSKSPLKIELVDAADAPVSGKVLKMELAGGESAPRPGTVALPFVPDRKFAIEFWIKGDSEGPVNAQITDLKYSVKTEIALSKKWQKVNMIGTTPGQLDPRTLALWVMFFVLPEQQTQTVYVSGFKFNYEK